MRWQAPYLLLWAAILVAQDGSAPDAIIPRIQARVAENLLHLPDYVCAQNVERAQRPSAREEFRLRDTLRLEVALIGGRERYAWRDARRFDDRELRDLIGKGMTGTGNFALHTQHVFQPQIARFKQRGAVTREGRRALLYDYDVAWENSAYRISNPPAEEVVAFRGSFLVDAETLDLLRLEILADEIPTELGLDRVSSVLEYSPVTIGTWSGLLPKSSELTMISLDGIESRNRTMIGDCREYRAESKLSFDVPAATAGPQVPPPPRVSTDPAQRMVLELSLDSDIALEAAAAGDPLRAVLTRALKDGERVIAPEGSVALGNIVWLEKQGQPFDHFEIALEFHTLETSQIRYEFFATMTDAGPAPGMIRQAKQLNPSFTRDRKPKINILVRQVQRGQGVLHWDGRRPRIPKALKMHWLIDDIKISSASP
jgi:hypothetical protein